MRQHSIHFQLADFLVVSVLREDLWSETENEKTVCQGRMAGVGSGFSGTDPGPVAPGVVAGDVDAFSAQW